MKNVTDFLLRKSKYIITIVLAVSAYSFARLPALPSTERAMMASRFSFTKHNLPEISGYPQKMIRAVNPSLYRLASWISAVGASVALNDLDGDGLSNDLCYVDTRIDQVIVSPAPSTPSRYEPFTLKPEGVAYDADTTAPMGCLPGDYNEDGRMDVLVYFWGRTPLIYLKKNEESKLSNASYEIVELVENVERWYTNAATQADLDGDGHIDLIIGNYFEDGARILDAKATVPDHMQHSMSKAMNGGRNRLLLWSGIANQTNAPRKPVFKEADALDEEVARGWTLAVGAADLDGDLLPEIYFANDFGPDRLLHNLSEKGRLRFELLSGEKTLTTPRSKTLGRDSFKGMGVDFGDLNGDGFFDIYVSNIAAVYALEESHFLWMSNGNPAAMKDRIAPYVDRSEELGLSRSGWGWDARLDDFDNDGSAEAVQATGFLKGEFNRWPELHELAMGNDQLLHSPKSWPRFQPGDDLSGSDHNPFFVRASDGRFYDLAPEIGLDDKQVSRGIAIADVDGDGRLDFAVANQWDRSVFYRNLSQSDAAFLGLRLLLPAESEKGASPSGRPAIGATATVYLPDGRTLLSQVDGGSGHSGKRSPTLHFGLGRHLKDQALKVVLRWRDYQGRVMERSVQLTPGWHTLMLDS